MASSTLITSPTFFNQRVTVPSVTDSPSWGIITFVGIEMFSFSNYSWVCSGLPASAIAASPIASDIVG